MIIKKKYKNCSGAFLNLNDCVSESVFWPWMVTDADGVGRMVLPAPRTPCEVNVFSRCDPEK